jgi:hypothetical protein
MMYAAPSLDGVAIHNGCEFGLRHLSKADVILRRLHRPIELTLKPGEPPAMPDARLAVCETAPDLDHIADDALAELMKALRLDRTCA